MPIKREVNKNFFKKWSPEMAYVLGFFAADGSMVKNRRGSCYLEFQITDKDILEKIRQLMNSNHVISKRASRKESYKQIYRLQIGSKEIYSDLIKIGFTQAKTHKMKWPDVPRKYVGDFIRGYFDGDGNVYLKKHFAKDRQKDRWVFSSRFTSGCRPFLEQLLYILRQNGISKGFIYGKERGCELTLSHRDSLALYGLMYNNSDCYLHLQRKKVIFEKAFKVMGIEY